MRVLREVAPGAVLMLGAVLIFDAVQPEADAAPEPAPVLSPAALADLLPSTTDRVEEVTSAAVAIPLTRESAEEAGVGAARSSVSLTPAPTSAVPASRQDAATVAEALASSPWPEALWDEVEAIAACESGGDASAVGDGGRAFGWLQVRPDYWPRLARSYDLLDGADNLTAGYIAYLEADGFWPWSCAAVLGIGGAG